MKEALALFDLHARCGDFSDRTWEFFRDGVEASWIYANGDEGPASALLRYEPGAALPWHWHPAYEHILVLEGSQSDENGVYREGAALISPPGTSHTVRSEEGCIVLAAWQKPVRFDREGYDAYLNGTGK